MSNGEPRDFVLHVPAGKAEVQIGGRWLTVRHAAFAVMCEVIGERDEDDEPRKPGDVEPPSVDYTPVVRWQGGDVLFAADWFTGRLVCKEEW